MAATGGANKAPQSFQDALGDVAMAIANAKLCPDADMGFLNKVEMVILGRLKHTDQQPGGAQPAGPAGGGAPGPGGAAPGGPPQPSPNPNGPPPQGGPAPHPTIPQMDPDEMRRVIAENTGS